MRYRGNADLRQVRTGCVLTLDVPMKNEWLIKVFPQIPEAGILQGVSVRLGLNVHDLHLQQVAGFGALDVEGTSKRMDPIEVAVLHVVVSVILLDLRISGVQRAYRHQLSWGDRRDGANIRMPAIMS